MRTPEEIANLLQERRNRDSPVIAAGLEMLRAYNGEMVVPLPELDAVEKPAQANLVAQAIDQTGMRIGSTMPVPIWTPDRQGIKAAENRARKKRDITLGWWNEDHRHDEDNRVPMSLRLRRRGRYMLAYGHSPVRIYPRLDGQPMWQTRDPLTSYPADGLDPDDLVPPDCIFVYKRPRRWLERNYPDLYARLSKADTTQSFEIVEYVDHEQCRMFVCGDNKPAESSGYSYGSTSGGYSGTSMYETMSYYPNRTDAPLVTDPARVTLGRRMGAYDGMLGMMMLQAKVMALSVIGMQRGIFPETWLVANENSQVKIVKHADPMAGIIGEAKGATLQQVRQDASPMAGVMVDRLAGAQREEGPVPSEWSGISGPNVRTGRRGEQIMGAAVDYVIQEAQALFERSIEAEDRMAIKVVKAWSGSRTFSMNVRGRGKVMFTPDLDFDDDTHEVRYAYSGADANGQTIRIGQMLGEELISRQTAMEQTPEIRDPEAEMDRIKYEQLERATWASVQQMASDPNAPLTPMDFARLAQLVYTDKANVWDALTTVHEEAQQRQMAAAQAQAAQQPPGAEQMPGVNPAALLRPEAMAALPAPGQGVTNMAELMSKLRRPNMALPMEQGAALPAGPA